MRAARLISMAAAFCGSVAVGSDGWKIEAGHEWDVKGKITGGRDVSAATLLGGGRGLVGSDETRGVQVVRLDARARRIDVEGFMALLDGEGTELDLEGMAFSKAGRVCYFVGSHALSRRKEEFEADRSLVIALPIDDAGMPRRDGLRRASLRPIIKADPALAPFLDKPASANGLDIEALAERDGRLYFGLRAPSHDGRVPVLVIDAAGLFSSSAPAVGKTLLELGPGRGIRDLTAVDGGFLLISGPSGTDDDTAGSPGAFLLQFWDGKSGLVLPVGVISAPSGKAEALLVVEETASHVLVLVFHDGAKDGAPRSLRVIKPASR
jgi:hypothetical protein